MAGLTPHARPRRRLPRARAPRPVAAILVMVAAFTGAVAIVSMTTRVLTHPAVLPSADAWVLIAFGVTIALAELARVPLGGGREAAPASTALALALAMTSSVYSGASTVATSGPTAGLLAVGADTTIAVTASAMAVGFLIIRLPAHRWAPPAVADGPRRSPRAEDLAIRFLVAALASLLFRSVPLWQGRTLLAQQPGWQDRRWVAAVGMALVSVVCLAVQSLLTATAAALDRRRSWRVALLDEARRAVGLSTALAATGVLIALAEPSLGVLAIPIFLVPLALAQVAVRSFLGSQTTYGETIRTLSRLTELGGYTPVDHPDRVAALSVEIARELGMSDREVRELEYAALLHDIGQVALRTPIPGGATMLAAPVDQDRIARDGAAIVRRTGVLDRVAEILEAQAKPYRHVRELGEVVPLSSRIVKVANAYDDLAGDRPTDRSRDGAVERIHLGLGYEYDPAVVDALQRVLEQREAVSLPHAVGAPGR